MNRLIAGIFSIALSIVALGSIALAPLSTVNAAEGLIPGLTKCAAMTRDLYRLACYDLLVSGKAPSSDIDLTSLDTNSTVVYTNKPTAVATPKSSSTFGLEQQIPPSSADYGKKTIPGDSDSLHSTIPGDFSGWKQGDKIKLANGQIWKVTGSKTLYHKATNPEVSITRGLFNSFRISIMGLNQATRVVRLK